MATVVLAPFVGNVPAAKVIYLVVPPVTKAEVAVPVNVDVMVPAGVIETLPEPAVPVNDGWKYFVVTEIEPPETAVIADFVALAEAPVCVWWRYLVIGVMEPPDTLVIYFSPSAAVVLNVNDGKEPAELILLMVAVPVPVK